MVVAGIGQNAALRARGDLTLTTPWGAGLLTLRYASAELVGYPHALHARIGLTRASSSAAVATIGIAAGPRHHAAGIV